jgi:REP element-mobilizing transposase RayT
MAFRLIYYHLIWTTKNRAPFITEQIEPMLLSCKDKVGVGSS